MQMQVQQPTPAADVGQTSESLSGVGSESAVIRDPAYLLRGKVWDRMSRGLASF